MKTIALIAVAILNVICVHAASVLEQAIVQLPPKAVADMPLKDRKIFLDDLKKDTPPNKRLDIANDYLEFSSDGETPYYASSMLYVKIFWIKGGGYIVFCHMPKPKADRKPPRPGQTFIFIRKDGEWVDVTKNYIPASIDIESCFVPRRTKSIMQAGTYKNTIVIKPNGGHDYTKQFDLIWNGKSFVVVKSPTERFTYDSP